MREVTRKEWNRLKEEKARIEELILTSETLTDTDPIWDKYDSVCDALDSSVVTRDE